MYFDTVKLHKTGWQWPHYCDIIILTSANIVDILSSQLLAETGGDQNAKGSCFFKMMMYTVKASRQRCTKLNWVVMKISWFLFMPGQPTSHPDFSFSFSRFSGHFLRLNAWNLNASFGNDTGIDQMEIPFGTFLNANTAQFIWNSFWRRNKMGR